MRLQLLAISFTVAISGGLCGRAVAASADPVGLVDPFIGTGGLAAFGDNNEGQTADFPGAAAPLGMIDWSPDTPTQPTSSGYWYHDTAITGFSLTHVSGAGCSIFGDFDILPTVGAVTDPAHAQQPFNHIDEIASPGYYAVALGKPPIRVELTAMPRAGLGSFTFPAGAQAHLLVNVSSDQAGVTDAQFQIVNDREIEGYASSGSFCGMPNEFTVYFVARFDRPFSGHGTWQHSTVIDGASNARGTSVGGYLTFDTAQNRTVRMRTAISYVSWNGASANLAAENASWDVNAVRRKTAAAWRSLLGRITIEGNTLPERRMFYTALYHVFLDPNLFSDADGSYRGFDQRVHHDAAGHAEYANFSGWDTYRTTMALQALLAPKESSDMIESLVHAAQQGGWLPKWPVANGYTGVMGGDAADPLIAGAFAFGARDFDTHAALAAMIKGAGDTASPPGQGWYRERPGLADYLRLGYVVNGRTTSVSNEPNGASETLEYALDDFAIARLARALGDRSVYERFSRRAANWTYLFNTATGLIAPRGENGAFEQQPLTPNGQSGFQEGDAWQYTWMVPQSFGALVRALGGPAATVVKLDGYLSSLNEGQTLPFAWMGNQPSFGDDWVYLWAGAPYRQQLVTREILTALYTPSPDGIPGNDDLGSMSAMWVWEAMGLYPVDVSVRDLELGAPLFARISIRAPGGPSIEITAPQAADGVPYIALLRVNGRVTQQTWLTLPQSGILRLEYALSRRPDVAWGASPQDAPPTYVWGPIHFPHSTAAALEMPAQSASLAPGESTTLQFLLENAQGHVPVRAAWSALAPDGLAIAPTRGAIEAAAYGRSGGAATVTATAAAATGWYDVAVTGVTTNRALLPQVYAPVFVAVPRRRAWLAYAADYQGNTITPIDPRTRAFGRAIQVDQNPIAVALSPDGSRAYVANNSSNDVSVVDTATGTLLANVAVGNAPTGIAISPDGATVWVTNNGDNTLTAIDAKSLTASGAIAVGSHPGAVLVSPNGTTVYVVNQGSGDVTPIDARTHKANEPIPAGARPIGAALSRDGKILYVANNLNAGTVSVIDLQRRAITATVAAGMRPRGIALSPDGATLYVTNAASATVTPINVRTQRPGAPIDVGGRPYDVVFTPDGKTAIVADRDDNDVTLIDVASGRAVGRIAAGNNPFGLAIR
ncbi:MAG TPA: GH92 family glycosyl hydrolase [Candidatus Babeliales bacterium]|nr:GH92 family glycosyl hydrolase [Candidatus Babeliales bacterium]